MTGLKKIGKIKFCTIFIIICMISVMSCKPLYCSWKSGYEQVKVKPDLSKLIGKYKLTEQSQDDLDGFNTFPLFLELKKGNEYILLFNENPVLLSDKIFASKEELLTNEPNRKGKWNLFCDDNLNGCMIELEEIVVENLMKKGNKFAIPITLGDGDECNGIIYEKME